MTRHDDRIRLQHMLDYAREAVSTTIPWPQVVGMRNRLIHGYDQVDHDILWDTIEIDMPPLIRELERILEPQ